MTPDPTPGPHTSREIPDPDPQPSGTAGLEPGGGVQPGDTPPAASSESEAVRHDEPSTQRARPTAVLVAVGLVSLAVVLFALVRALDLLG